jgi:ATPase subunit of ABC transporter with duplicated ATPase domains
VPSLVASRVSFAYSDSVPLIRELSFDLHPGWTGVVGANGAGKTTLLRLLAGELEPDAGRVQRRPPSLRSRVCPQTVEELGADVRELADAQEGAAQRLRGRLALEPAELERWPSLSPGERKRWQVGAALFAEPQLLILDEPTNHLDASARERLLLALTSFAGLGLLVSHDRTLLDALTTTTLRFDRGDVRVWRGSYSEARQSWESEEREQVDAYQKLQSEKRKLRRRLADARQKRAEAEARMKRKMRRAPIKDIDTRKRFSAKRRRSAEVSLGWEVHKLHGSLDRVEERAAVFDLAKARGRSLFVDWEPAPIATLLSFDGDQLCAGERELLADVHVRVERGSRIHLCGDNGAGKTTLVRALLDAPHVPDTKILHLPQELTADEGARLLAELRETPDELQGRILAILAALGVDPAALLASASPSPGEARKIALAGGLARLAWLLVLDEPTNHLDLPSIERIERALADYPGALLVVTHDDAFARRCTTTQWRLCAGHVEVSSRAPA